MKTEINIATLHCGLYHCPLVEAHALMPELSEIFSSAPINPKERYVVDVRASMLMPFQWPCIPGWHFDNIPRDEYLVQRMEKRDPSKIMLAWISGPPLTEFMRPDGSTYFVEPQKWFQFTQFDLHRGTMATEHTWRVFVRLTPEPLIMPAQNGRWLRRHTQVYLDANNFKW